MMAKAQQYSHLDVELGSIISILYHFPLYRTGSCQESYNFTRILGRHALNL